MRAQHGIISRKQAHASGVSDRQIASRVRRGAWFRVLAGVYLSADTVRTWHTWAFAFVAASGSDAVVIGESAAVLRRLAAPTFPITLAVPTSRRPRVRHPRVRVIRMNVPRTDCVMVDGLPTTTRLRTAVDLAHLMAPVSAQPIIDRMLVLNLVDIAELTAAVNASARTGSRQARELIATANDLAAAESERYARRLLCDAGITGWVSNVPIMLDGHERKLDLALPHLRIGIEVKGWTFHSSGDQGAADDARVVAMQLKGWIVIPISWLALQTDPDAFIRQVRAAVAQREREARAS